MSIFKKSESYRPFQYTWAVEAAKRHAIDMFWDVHQVELQDDVRQFMSKDGLATPNVSHEVNKHILLKLLCVFTEMDATVAAGYKKILQYVHNNECSNLLLTEAAREVVHQRAYALAGETFGLQDADWSEFQKYVQMRDKLDAMSEDLTKPEYRDELKGCIYLAQVLLGEGVGLFAAFASLLNLKRFGKVIGFNDINQWSLVDEQDHVVNNIRMLKDGRKDLTEVENLILNDIIRQLLARYIEAEHVFIDLVYEIGEQEDLTIADLKEYIVYLSELREFQLDMRSAAEVRKNPLPWMEWMLSGSKHDNFFEKRVTDYSHSKLPGDVNYKKYRALLDNRRVAA